MTAVTGVKAHQTMLDVTGNNIANVNTTGFKRDTTLFQDLLFQTSRSASGAGDNRGGTNPAQVGLGVQLAAIETIHSQGFAQYTGNKSDVMITGAGYFIFDQGTGSSSRIYSRAGNFYVGPETGYRLTMSGNGYLVQGYKMDRDPLHPTEYVLAGDISEIRIPLGTELEARATTVVGIRGNLDSQSDPYLPIGFADIAYTSTNTPAEVKIEGIDYKTEFATGLNSADGKNYLTITLDGEATPNPAVIVLDMVGIENGVPVLAVNTTDTVLNLNGTSAGTGFLVDYDADTGLLKLTKNVTGATDNGTTLWETNLHESMSYASFMLEDKTAVPVPVTYNFIAEFDESDLDGSPTELTLWYEEADAAGAVTIKQVTATVSFKSDGTFDTVSDIVGTLPSPFAAHNVKIVPSTNGTSLEIKVAKDLTDPAPELNTFDTVSQITQGGSRQTKMTVYDCQGFPYTLEVQFKKLTANRWKWEAFFVDESEGGATMGKLMPTPSSGEITFDESCLIVSPMKVDIDVPYSLFGRENETITLDFGGESFNVDKLEGLTQFAGEASAKVYYQDGYMMGVMNDYEIGQNGIVTGVFTNGQKQSLYRLALAQFANPMGLEKIGESMFSASINSGMAMIDPAMESGAGSIISGSLEMSNVDLTEEFTRLIIAQRGFQANTRVVTVSDQILEEVVNLKR
jgi:flagellar hook protein FlgE